MLRARLQDFQESGSQNMRQVASNTEEVKDWFRVEMENSGGFD